MGVDMYHHTEILEAICALCTSSVRLSEDAGGSAVLRVGSNRLFSAGDNVDVLDDDGGPESHTVSELNGLTEIVLDSAVSGTYTVSRHARVRLNSGDGPALAWVSRGTPELAPRPIAPGFPCVVVEPTRMEQPLKGGTNRAYTQDYWTSVYYIRRRSGGEDEELRLLDEVDALFNLLMSDPYLGGTCWYSQVTMVDYTPEVEAALKERGTPVRAVRLDMVARRSELNSDG